MPKLKTKKSATKRFKITKNGKVLINKSGKQHILTKKSSSRKRKLRRHGELKKCETEKVIRMMPYA